MHFGTTYSSSPNRYGGPGYGSSSTCGGSNHAGMLRRPSYNTQISSDGYSSTGGGYSASYNPKYRNSGCDFIPGGNNPILNSQTKPSQFSQQQPPNDYYRDRPNSVAGDYSRQSSYNSGYNSDYGRSGYASGNNSDYGSGGGVGGQSGLISGPSDYSRQYSPSNSKSNNYYEAPYRRSRTSSDHSKGLGRNMSTSSRYTSPSPARSYSSYSRSPGGGKSSVSSGGKIGSGRTNYSLHPSSYTSSGARNNVGSYSGRASREVSPVKMVKSSSGNLSNRATPDGSSKKPKNCKAPADFTSESSSSSSTDDSEDETDDSPNEDAAVSSSAYVICRSTSPTQKPPRPDVEQLPTISSSVKMKKTKPNINIIVSEMGTQTTYDDFHPNQKPASNSYNADSSSAKDRGKTSSRYIPSPSTTKLSSGYYDRYYNKYTSPTSSSRSTTTCGSSSRSSRVSCSPTKNDSSGSLANRSANTSGSKLNVRNVSRQNSHEDCQKSTPTSPRSPQQDNAQVNYKLSNSNSGSKNCNKSGSNISTSNTEVENKEFRKSVLNMNVSEEDVDTTKVNDKERNRTQLSKSQSRVNNIHKSASQNASVNNKSQSVQNGDNSSSSSSVTSSDDQPVNNYRPPSRQRVNSEKSLENEAVSKSKSNLDVRNRRGSSKSSQEDLLDRKCRKGSKDGPSCRVRKSSNDGPTTANVQDDKRRSSREDFKRRPRSRQTSNEEEETSEDEHESQSGRNSVIRRRRRNDDEQNRLTPKRQGSAEGLVEDLPPRPSRHGSKESILDERPSSKMQLSSSSKTNSQNSSRENLLSDEKSSTKNSSTKRKANNSPAPVQANLGPGRWIVPASEQLSPTPSKSPTPVSFKVGEASECNGENYRRSSPDGIENQSAPNSNFFLGPPNAQRPKSLYEGKSTNKNTGDKFIGQYKDIDNLLNGSTPLDSSFDNSNNRLIVVTAPPPSDSDLRGKKADAKKTVSYFIGKCQDIDDVLGKVPTRPSHLNLKSNVGDDESEADEDAEASSSAGEEVEASVVKVHDSKAQQPQLETYTEEIDSSAVRIRDSRAVVPELEVYTEEIDASGVRIKNHPRAMKGNITTTPTLKRLEPNCTIQQPPKSNHNQYFDPDKKTNKNNAQVTSIIDKLTNLEGKELQQILFSLKQLFQDDQQLVNGFVKSDGLSYLIRLGFDADSTYQNYILRALGQIMLYVDGMKAVTTHVETVQWLYSLISSKFRAISKTALKLLNVFVEYEEPNCSMLINVINSVDSNRNMKPWSNVMVILNEKESVDMETLSIAASLINKTLRGINDRDTFYDVIDYLEIQGMERVVQRYMSKQGSDHELLEQFQIYESVLRHEDEGEEKPYEQKQSVARRQSLRQSQNHVAITPPTRQMVNQNPIKFADTKVRRQRENKLTVNVTNKSASDSKLNDLNGVTPALRRRREREAQNRLTTKEAEVNINDQGVHNDKNMNDRRVHIDEENRKNREMSRIPCRVGDNIQKVGVQWKSGGYFNKSQEANDSQTEDGWSTSGETSPRIISQAEVFDLRRENTVKDIQKKLRSQETIQSPTDTSHLGDFSGLVNRAKEGLNKSSSRTEMKPNGNATTTAPVNEPQVKKAENDLQWDNLRENLNKPLIVKDLNFTDLLSEDDEDIFNNRAAWGKGPGPPCPPPLPCPMMGPRPPPPPPSPNGGKLGPPPPLPPENNRVPHPPPQNQKTIKKNKKTVKLFWKEVSDDHSLTLNNNKAKCIWDELKPVNVDTQKLEHLFENRAKDLMNKKQQEMNRNKEIIVLDPKRSNAINIGMTKLPPPRTIKSAVLKMDSSIMNREGIEKILTTMMPTEEEISKIIEAQMNNPDVPLGSAEQFLLTLASITELPARLKLWAFKLDYDIIEREVAEPLMDLKQGIEDLKKNNTFRCILAMLLSIGNFLNGAEVKGFQIDYLAKVPEVKDTVHKHSLLHHLFHMVMEKFPDTTDLYSEIGTLTRAAKVDFDELAYNLTKLETECKASWDHLKAILKHDGSASAMKAKMTEFLAESAEHIIVLGIIHRRVLNRFYKFLLYLGVPPRAARETKINHFLKTISEFALEYRTTRERFLQQLQKKISHKERNKTKGKFFQELAKSKEVQADDELRQLLGGMSDSDESYKWGTMPGVRGRNRKSEIGPPPFNRSSSSRDESMTDGDEEFFESLAKNYRNNPRERRRMRQTAKK